MVALDLALDDDLRRRGYLRDVVRQVQELRKNSGLDVADRVVLWLTGVEDLADGFATLAAEVLAVEILSVPGEGPGAALELDDDRVAFAWVKKATERR